MAILLLISYEVYDILIESPKLVEGKGNRVYNNAVTSGEAVIA